MPKKRTDPLDETELLTRILALNMWTARASQDAIARAVGRGKAWVNGFLRGVPKPKPLKSDD